jgi:hypothetical protein
MNFAAQANDFDLSMYTDDSGTVQPTHQQQPHSQTELNTHGLTADELPFHSPQMSEAGWYGPSQTEAAILNQFIGQQQSLYSGMDSALQEATLVSSRHYCYCVLPVNCILPGPVYCATTSPLFWHGFRITDDHGTGKLSCHYFFIY